MLWDKSNILCGMKEHNSITSVIKLSEKYIYTEYVQ